MFSEFQLFYLCVCGQYRRLSSSPLQATSNVVCSVSLTSAGNNCDFDKRFAFIFSSQHVSTTGALFTWWFLLEFSNLVISGFRVCFFSTIVLHLCLEFQQLYYTYFWKSCACISYYPAFISPRIYATTSVIKKLAI